jgi:predicted membrane protein
VATVGLIWALLNDVALGIYTDNVESVTDQLENVRKEAVMIWGVCVTYKTGCGFDDRIY